MFVGAPTYFLIDFLSSSVQVLTRFVYCNLSICSSVFLNASCWFLSFLEYTFSVCPSVMFIEIFHFHRLSFNVCWVDRIFSVCWSVLLTAIFRRKFFLLRATSTTNWGALKIWKCLKNIICLTVNVTFK